MSDGDPLTDFAILAAYRRLASYREVACELQLPVNKVALIIRQLLGKKPKLNERHDEMLKLYQLNLNDIQISREMKVTRSTIITWRKRNKLKPVVQTWKERAHFNRKRFKRETGGCETKAEFQIVVLIRNSVRGKTPAELLEETTISRSYLYKLLRELVERKVIRKKGRIFYGFE